MPNALISVFNKENIYELCDFLISNEYTIYSSGGTYKYLSDKYNTNIKLISDLTGFPEILNGIELIQEGFDIDLFLGEIKLIFI